MLVILVPAVSVLFGLSVDFCLCCYYLRRRRAAQHRLAQVQQVVTLYTVLRRAVRFKRSAPRKEDGSGEEQICNSNGIGGSGSSGKVSWLAKTVGAIISIKRLRLSGGSKVGGAAGSASQANHPNIPPDADTGHGFAAAKLANCSAEVTMLDEPDSTEARQAVSVLAEGRAAVVSPMPAVAWAGNQTLDSEITSVDDYNHGLDSDDASAESALQTLNAEGRGLAQGGESIVDDPATDDVSEFIVPSNATQRKT